MNSTDHFSQIDGSNGESSERAIFDYLLFMLATVLIIVGVMMLFLTLRELYLIYQSPIESTFIARVAQFLTNTPFVVGASGNTIVVLEGAAKILAFFLFFLFVSLVVSVGTALLKAGINILPKVSGKLSKIRMNRSVPNLEINAVPSTSTVEYKNKD